MRPFARVCHVWPGRRVCCCSTFEEVHADLVKAAKQGKGVAVKVAAADALAVCCFVAAEDERTTMEVMDQLFALWNKGEACWAACSCVPTCLLACCSACQLG